VRGDVVRGEGGWGWVVVVLEWRVRWRGDALEGL